MTMTTTPTMMTTTTSPATMTKIINLCTIKCDTSLKSQDWRNLESKDDDNNNNVDGNDNNFNDNVDNNNNSEKNQLKVIRSI